MPQGKMKVKTKKPINQVKKDISKEKNSATIQKKNRPALPKPTRNSLRTAITKSINEVNENAAKERASLDGKSFHVIPPPVATSSGVPKGKSKSKPKK